MFGRDRKSVCGAVIAAAGSGARMHLAPGRGGAAVNKVFLELCGAPVLAHTLTAFERCRKIGEIVVVTRECDIALCKQLADEFNITKLKSIICGGTTRQESVRKGLTELSGGCELAAIHDGARCLIQTEDIDAVIEEACLSGAACLGTVCADSLKRTDSGGYICEDIDRSGVYMAQTPQVFDREKIIAAHKQAAADGFEATDDCAVARRAGIHVKMVEARSFNIKLTTQKDLALAEALLSAR